MTIVGTARRDAASTEFFDAAAERRLLIRTCSGCGHHRAAQAEACNRCGQSSLVSTVASGRGTVVTWTVQAPRDAPDQPLTSGLVELDEGPWLFARLLAEPSLLRVGLPVTVQFVESGEEFVPCFAPIS